MQVIVALGTVLGLASGTLGTGGTLASGTIRLFRNRGNGLVVKLCLITYFLVRRSVDML